MLLLTRKTMEPSPFLIERICDICVALGGLGTVGTLIYMICDSRRKSKQIDSIQKIQSLQLESLYAPNLRVISWTFKTSLNTNNDIVINNHGEDLVITKISKLSESCILNSEGMKRWFPYNLDKNESIHIPLSFPINDVKEPQSFIIVCYNKLGITYHVLISIIDGEPKIQEIKSIKGIYK